VTDPGDTPRPEIPFEDFDRYCDEHGIGDGEYGAAFAAWLHEISGGKWDGRAEQVTSETEGNDR
jgi:hypothetical protein